jgi:TRAP-type C4-dicarboxylate transport system substrate-binding protein
LKEEGVKMTHPDRKPFQEASQKVYEMWAEKVGGMELIKKILNFDYQSIIEEEHPQK